MDKKYEHTKSGANGSGCFTFLFAVLTGMVGYHMHGSMFWAVMDVLFWPIAILKWIIYQEVTLTIIKETFYWFFK